MHMEKNEWTFLVMSFSSNGTVSSGYGKSRKLNHVWTSAADRSAQTSLFTQGQWDSLRTFLLAFCRQKIVFCLPLTHRYRVLKRQSFSCDKYRRSRIAVTCKAQTAFLPEGFLFIVMLLVNRQMNKDVKAAVDLRNVIHGLLWMH